MKPLSSFLLIVILFQSLFIGSLVKLELHEDYTEKWEIPLIHNQSILDPFLMPGKEGIDQNLNHKNEWVPFHYNKLLALSNNSLVPLVNEILYKRVTSDIYKTIPIYIQNRTLRI